MESAYPSYVINFVHGHGKLLLRRWKSGMADYYSVIFTKRNSGIKSLEDLKGKTRLRGCGSTSGYLLPKFVFAPPGIEANGKNEDSSR